MKKVTILFWSIPVLIVLFVMFHFPLHSSKAATSTSIAGDIEFSTEQVGPLWYNESWHYRRPVIISNNNIDQLTDYQVLIKLDNSNFDFSKAKSDGSDVRFTANDGITERSYWIESFNKSSQLAYIWVKVPLIPNGNSTIYLYYSNPAASDDSNGSATFDFFDDKWCQFPGGGCVGQVDPWSILNGAPTVSNGNLVLINNSGVSTIYDQYKNNAVGFRANFGLGAGGYEWGGFIDGAGGHRTVIGDLPSPDNDDLFLQNFVSGYDNNRIERVGDVDWHNAYHTYEVRWWTDNQYPVNNQSVGNIDHGLSSVTSVIPAQVPTGPLPVTFYSFLGSNATIMVDWVYVREYRYPEPTVAIGMEQGAVDLKVKQVDSPDPLYAGEEVTYILTVSNTSSIDAMGVILTDTLPGEFNFVSAFPSQGSCSSVICNLGTIPKYSDASITLKAKTSVDGVFTNTAVVNSLSYDLDTNNNSSQATTTVLPSADLALNLRVEPEAVMPQGTLTYIITVTNQGPSLAGMVNIVNNLPLGVEYQSSSPNICSVSGTSTVTCPLTTSMAPNSNSQIRIIGKVKSTTTQYLDSSATVSSAIIYDPIPANNTNLAETLLDATIPEVHWISPIHDEATYITYGGWITLEASAVDKVYNVDQIYQVEFKLWNHLLKPKPDWGWSGISQSAPYQIQYDPSNLVQGEVYQMYVYATDRAGNQSRQRILIVRQYSIFLPLTRK